MKKAYIALLAVLFAVALFGFKQVSADTVTIDGVLNASFGGSNPDVPTNISGTLGSRLSFDTNLGVTPGFSFGYWVINDFIRPELAVDYEFMISSKFELDALFAPDGSHVVVFADSNGKVLNVQRVLNGGSASDASISVPSRPGLTVASPKWKTLTNETSLENITGNKVFFLQYTVSSSTTYTLSVTNGTGGGEKTYNQIVTVSANADSEGSIFSHWEEDGFIVSTQRNFSFTMLSNRSLTAVFVASGPEANSPRVTLRDDLIIRSGFHSYVGQYYIPSGYELVEFGLITSTDSAVITHSSANTTVHQGSKAIVETNEFLMSFAIGSHQSVRAYLVVTDGSTVSTVYSDNNVKFIDAVSYQSGFESNTKTAYTLETLNIDGVNFEFSDALIGTDASDRKDDLKSVRIRNGYIKTQTGFDMIKSISFKYAKYGTDLDSTIDIQVSKDGTTWTSVSDALGSATISVTSTTLATANIVLKNSANYIAGGFVLSDSLYVRIIKTGTTRVNIDAFTVNEIYNGAIHTVTFNNQGSTTSADVMNGSTATQPSNPSKTGYSFAGWYSNSEYTGDPYVFSTAVTSSFTLFAKFNINQYTITFSSNGGTAVSSITQDYASTVNQPSDPTKTGYTFGGWYSDAGFSSAYTFGTMPATNTTLYAEWSVNQYTISFNTNGGTSVTSITQNYGTDVSAPVSPTKEGYTFVRWYISDSEVAYTFSTMPSENLTLNALWADASTPTYTVTFNSNGGSSIAEATVAEGDSVSQPSNPSKSSYTFDGWYTDPELTIAYIFSSPVSSSFNLYAKWIATSTTVTAAYSGPTTNMVDGNNATTIGLNASIFTVTSTKGSNNLHVGLNSAGQMRLYYSTTSTKNTLTFSINPSYTITKVEVVFGGTAGNTRIVIGSTNFDLSGHANTTQTYDSLNITSFSIANTNPTNTQVYIVSVKITYIPIA